MCGRVSRFTFCSVEPGHVNRRRWRKKISLALSSLLCSCVCAKDYYTFPPSRFHLERQARQQRRRRRFSISQCIFIESQLQPDGPALAEWIKWRRVTVCSSLRAHLTFSSAAIFLPVGPSRSLTGYLKSRARRAS